MTGGVADRIVREMNPISNQTNTELIRVEVATSLALLVGLIQFIMGLTGLGVLTSFFSDTFISSYTCGSAVHVIVSQVKDFLLLAGKNEEFQLMARNIILTCRKIWIII